MTHEAERADGSDSEALVSAFSDRLVGDLLESDAVRAPSRPGIAAELDRFDILRALGSGGIGVVVLARDTAGGTLTAIKMLRPALAGQAELVHRLDGEGHAHLTDFGLTPATLHDVTGDTALPGLEQTLPYMSPNTLQGRAGDTRCDIYAFGAVLYEMLTGVAPYAGTAAEQVREAILSGPPTPLRKKNREADPKLAAVAEWAMARELRDRYAEMADVAADLRRIQSGEPPVGPHHVKPSAARRRVAVALIAVVAGGALAMYARRFAERPEPAPAPAPAFARTPAPAPASAPEPEPEQVTQVAEVLDPSASLDDIRGHMRAAFTALNDCRFSDAARLFGELDHVLQVTTNVTNTKAREAMLKRARQLGGEARFAIDASRLELEEQVNAVRAELLAQNPESDVEIDIETGGGVIRRVSLSRGKVVSLGPLRGLPLEGLFLREVTGFRTLAPLSGMKLTAVKIDHCPNFSGNITPLIGMPLEWLNISHSNIRSYEALRGMPLKTLHSGWNPAKDLEPLRDLALQPVGTADQNLESRLDDRVCGFDGWADDEVSAPWVCIPECTQRSDIERIRGDLGFDRVDLAL